MKSTEPNNGENLWKANYSYVKSMIKKLFRPVESPRDFARLYGSETVTVPVKKERNRIANSKPTMGAP